MDNGLANLKFSSQDIEKITKNIYHQILSESKNIESGNFEKIGLNDFKHLFDLYDLYFFDGYFNKNFGKKIFFGLSKRMTKSGGKTQYTKQSKTYRIILSTTLIFQTFSDVSREVRISGILCQDRLEATMRILEHEIIHLIEFILYGSSSCSKPRFKLLSNNIFGHTGVTHQLVTQKERAHKKFNLHIGDEVFFEYGGKTFRGIIYRITKRATVMVLDSNGCYRDSQGKKYSKYYVPLDFLEKSEN